LKRATLHNWILNMSDDTNSSSSSAGSVVSTALFICSIIVLANVDPNEYNQIRHIAYYNFILMLPCLLAGGAVLMCCITASSMSSGKINWPAFYLLFLSVFIIILTFMGMVWHNDPRHSIIFYKEFWTENALVFETPPKHAWAYVMGDIIIRIESVSIMIICFVMGLGGLCTCCGAVYKCHDSNPSLIPV